MKRMQIRRKKMLIAAAVAVILLVVAITPALAGGWAVLTLDELPQNVQAGQEVTIRFMIRQHGVTPFTGAEPVVEAKQPNSNLLQEFKAVELPEPGHYQAVIKLPKAGVWRWTINGFGEHPMPDLNVLPASVVPTGGQTSSRLPAGAVWLVIGLLATVVAGSLYLLQKGSSGRPRPWAWGILLLPLLAAGLVVYNTQAQSQQQPTKAPEIAPLSAYDTGQALFVAKGCVTCHSNSRIPNRYVDLNVAIGPDLTNHPQSAEYLRAWLKDPAALKPDTQMPNLGLRDAEIEALIAFVLPENN